MLTAYLIRLIIELGNNLLSGTIPIPASTPDEGCVTFPNPFSSFMSRIHKTKYAKAIESSLETLSLCKCFF